MASQSADEATKPQTLTIDDLVSKGKLTVSLEVKQKDQQIVGQALIIAIEVATDRWFAKGTSIENFNLANTVMQANNKVTINGSKRIKSQTWATQTHEFTLYPTRAGTYHIAPLTLNVSVNTEEYGIVDGQFNTEPTEFSVHLPELLKEIESFIVSPLVELTVDGTFDEEKEYAIGEAVTQTITITTLDTPAMMIPELNLVLNEDMQFDGVSVYRKPAQVFDKSNRGSLSGTRVETLTYIFEKTGQYEIPERNIYWWNSQTNTLETLVIPASTWRVSGGGSTLRSGFINKLADLKPTFTIILAIAVIVMLGLIAVVIAKYRQTITAFYKTITRYQQRQVQSHFLTAIKRKDYLLASQYLYQYASLANSDYDLKTASTAIKVNRLAFASSESLNNNQDSLGEPIEEDKVSLSDARALIKQIGALDNKNSKDAYFSSDKPIKLNNR